MKVRLRQEGSQVWINWDDKCWMLLGAKELRQIWREMDGVLKLAEEYEQADRIIQDTAIMLRAGAPFALSDNRKIVESAKTMAAWDSDLRRYMPMRGITSQERFGTPSIKQTMPRMMK